MSNNLNNKIRPKFLAPFKTNFVNYPLKIPTLNSKDNPFSY